MKKKKRTSLPPEQMDKFINMFKSLSDMIEQGKLGIVPRTVNDVKQYRAPDIIFTDDMFTQLVTQYKDEEILNLFRNLRLYVNFMGKCDPVCPIYYHPLDVLHFLVVDASTEELKPVFVGWEIEGKWEYRKPSILND